MCLGVDCTAQQGRKGIFYQRIICLLLGGAKYESQTNLCYLVVVVGCEVFSVHLYSADRQGSTELMTWHWCRRTTNSVL